MQWACVTLNYNLFVQKFGVSFYTCKGVCNLNSTKTAVSVNSFLTYEPKWKRKMERDMDEQLHSTTQPPTGKGKMGHTPLERRWGAHLPS